LICRDPVMRISTSLLALCCQSGLDATFATPIRARRRSIGSRSLRISPLLTARFTSAVIAEIEILQPDDDVPAVAAVSEALEPLEGVPERLTSTQCTYLSVRMPPEKSIVRPSPPWDAPLGSWSVFLLLQLQFVRDAFRSLCIPLGMRLDSAIISVPNRLRHCLMSERRFQMAQRAIRFSERQRTRRFGRQPGSAVSHHQRRSSDIRWNRSCRSAARNSSGAEEGIAASIEQVRQELFRLGRAQQALFAFLDSVAKVVLTCVPEPGGEALEAAVARARGRHSRLLKNAGQAMVGDFAIGVAGFGETWRR
jgi:hypothetical protein